MYLLFLLFVRLALVDIPNIEESVHLIRSPPRVVRVPRFWTDALVFEAGAARGLACALADRLGTAAETMPGGLFRVTRGPDRALVMLGSLGENHRQQPAAVASVPRQRFFAGKANSH